MTRWRVVFVESLERKLPEYCRRADADAIGFMAVLKNSRHPPAMDRP
jgi:hypothetical protein